MAGVGIHVVLIKILSHCMNTSLKLKKADDGTVV